MEKTKTVEIKVEGKKWETAIDNALEKNLKNANIPGFRKGHVPKDVFLKKYGKESLYMDAANESLNDAYKELIEKNKDLELVAEPEINIKDINDKGITFEFTLTLKPEVKLGKYTGLNVKKESTKVTKEEINKTIGEMRNRYAENVTKKGAVANGDIAVIDFEGFKDGVAFAGGKGENYSLTIGSNTFIPGFEDQLIGMKKGEVKEIEVTFPKDYQAEELKGAKATFKVKVNEVKEVKIPELDKDFFEDLGMEGVDSKETLEAEVKKTIEAQKERNAENKYMDDLLEAAAKNVKVEIPHVMIHEEAHRMVHQYEETLRMQGLTLEQFYEFTHSDEHALMEQMEPEAEKRVLYRLMLEEIAKTEKINPTKKEVEEEAERLAKQYEMPKDEFLKAFGGIEMVEYDIKMRNAMETLKK
nr:trigger factor [Bacilli bacterium]